jgi:hypothetical protein
MFAVAAQAQTVQVYSEFARLSESGEVLAPEEPREILSPVVPRNAFTTFQVAVQVPQGTKYHVFIGQNPEGAVKATLYRRGGEKLEAVGLPYEGTVPQVFWLDVWVDESAPVRRVKIEPQVFVNGDWVTYPMEVRVSEVAAPVGAKTNSLQPWDAMQLYLCRGGARFFSMAPAPERPRCTPETLSRMSNLPPRRPTLCARRFSKRWADAMPKRPPI